ncbi:hypothetical protein Pmani_001612 [Petrolisthes manimaculis]|uniref:ABC transporter domain-containing protein n=1 Tax=Petrolisthes manimaculis TaxID=1843537 RepID=A0AAE1UP99_9EUCA|nr:hypothetical protein Pmani_001612 [Petrolisthes manimaculis]
MSQLYGSFLPSYVVLSFILLSPSLIKSVVHEKETGVRELVRLMGMNRWLVWGGWFLHALVVVILVVTIITIMITVGLPGEGGVRIPPILNYSNPFLVWLILFLYGICSIAFCLTVSTFFSRPTLATTLGILVWLFSYYIPNTFIYFNYDDLGLTPKILACFLPNMAMTLSFRVISMFEGRALGVQWDNLWTTGNPRDELTPGMIMLMLVLDLFLYCFLIWYVDQISPGTYGVSLPWYFPFQKSYWFGTVPSEEGLGNGEVDSKLQQNFEEEPEGLRPGIVIRNLRKEFRALGRKTKVAVENVSMTCYEGQCTVLLGHNGAGKTTTMSILTGVFAPSGGAAEVGGWNIATHLKEAREELGLCPQHNMLFVDLTVLQHLLFFGRLKGMKTKEAMEEAMEVLQRLDLWDKKDMFGDQLSGGMKRKLCLAISFIGGSKVVILDEPSSGLDPESRRWVWQVVQGERGRRTVLVTTHHMEEADVLGDRVAIMSSGRVVCAGSTLFLKNKFGDGYTLDMIVKEGCDLNSITQNVTQHMPLAELKSQRGGEVSYKLPPTTSHFASLLTSLTTHKEEFGISHVGLSLTTMEQVFLRVSEVLDKEDHLPGLKELNAEKRLSASESSPEEGDAENGLSLSSQKVLYKREQDRLHGWSLVLARFKAFFIKRAIYTKRKWPLFITQGLVPVVVSIVCLLVDQTLDFFTTTEPPLTLSIDLFPYTYSYVHAESNIITQDLAHTYKSMFHDPYEVYTTDNMTSTLLQTADENLLLYRENHICSASFLNNEATTKMRVLGQTVPFHTMGIGTSLVTNALLQYATNTTTHTISTTNRPLPPDRAWMFSVEFSTSSYVYAYMMPLALAFLSSSFLVFPLQERESNTKQVQIMTGAPVWALWATSFVWDMAAYLLTLVLILLSFVALDPNGYFTASGEAVGALIMLLFLYGFGSIPMAYLFSFLFQTAASGFAVLALVNIVAGQLLVAVVWGLNLAETRGTEIAAHVLSWISSFIPSYGAARGFGHLVETSVHNVKCDQFDVNTTVGLCLTLVSNGLEDNDFMECCRITVPWFGNDSLLCSMVGQRECFQQISYFSTKEPGLGLDLISLVVDGIVFFAIISAIELGAGRSVMRWWYSLPFNKARLSVENNQYQMEDDDVAAETRLVDSLIENKKDITMMPPGAQDNSLLVHKLAKKYLGSIVRAVNDISFRVGRGECLGLLGVNGAGKTTTFKMLTGEEQPTAGDALIDGLSLKHQRNKFLQNIGYCPQFDAFLGDLTGVEMLELMGRLRGLREESLRELVGSLVIEVGLTECANRPSSTYSGGNRRKLSTGMALIAQPQLVFLDEPTSGVDPTSRRRVWAAVSQAVSRGQSIVLTSHSMEECEALCSRIIIMAKGNLRCVGTPAHLKAKYGQGYSLQIKLKTHGFSTDKEVDEQEYTRKVSELQNTITHNLSGAVITDQHRGMVAYRIPSSVAWGQLFTVMEGLKTEDNIVEVYAASDTTLEQVFLSFAREATQTNFIPSVDPSPIQGLVDTYL